MHRQLETCVPSCSRTLAHSLFVRLSSSVYFIGNVGVPVKLLFEAEGMKITVEVGPTCFVLDVLSPLYFSNPPMWSFVHLSQCSLRMEKFTGACS